MKVEIWSDIICPFCYIGKRRFEEALTNFKGKDKVEIVWRSFQLDPDLKYVPGQNLHAYLGKRKGGTEADGKKMNDAMTEMAREVGLHYDFDKAVLSNTIDAHRVLHLARHHGKQNQMKERLLAAYFTEGKNIGDPDTLAQLSKEVGLDKTEVKNMLASEDFRKEVQQDIYQAQQVGARGVPFFVFNQKYAVSGAQPCQLFKEVLEKVWDEEKPTVIGDQNDASCEVEGNC